MAFFAELGQNWDRIGTELGQNWDRIGTESGQNWDKIGTELKRIPGPEVPRRRGMAFNRASEYICLGTFS